MTEPPSQMSNDSIAILIRRAQRGTLEVEHLLHAARNPSIELADALDALSNKMEWLSGDRFPEVPWASWIIVIGVFCRQGFEGLLDKTADPALFNFVIGLLEDLQTTHALRACVQIIQKSFLLSNTERAIRLAGAMNLLAMRVGIDGLTASEQIEARHFLHDVLAQTRTDIAKGTILCALRYFGNDISLSLVRACPPLAEHWESARRAAIRGIKKTIRKRTP